MKLQVNGIDNDTIPMHDLQHGCFGIIVENPYAGTVVFRVPAGAAFAAFNTNGCVDSFSLNAKHRVRVLRTGENFTITV